MMISNSKPRQRIILLLPFALLLSTNLHAVDLGVATGHLYHPYLEWKLENPSWDGNPFDLAADVEFTHVETREKRETGMFYLGHDRWGFRFAATKPGEWTFRTNSTDEDLDGHHGRVLIDRDAAGSAARGFLTNLNGKWGWGGKRTAFVPQLVMWEYVAGDHSPAIFAGNSEVIDANIQEFIAGHGFNGFHLPVVAARWFDLDAPGDRVSQDMINPDPRTFEALEMLISKTYRAGGMVHIWPWGDHQRRQTARSLEGGINGAIDQRLQRYIAARLGPIPGWSMGYGFDLDEWVEAGQLRVWRDFMHVRMGWHHFLGGRPVGPNHGADHKADAAWNRGLDYSSYEHHRPTFEVYVAAINALPGIPVMSEDRFRIRQGKYPEKDYDEERTRRGLYHSTMAGGVGNIWGIHPELSSDGVFPNKEHLKTYSIFFHGKERFLEDMVPSSRFGQGDAVRVLWSQAAESLVVYGEMVDELSLDLGVLQSSVPAVAVDTIGGYAEIDLGQLRPERQTVKLPKKSDWVIALGDFSARPASKREARPK